MRRLFLQKIFFLILKKVFWLFSFMILQAIQDFYIITSLSVSYNTNKYWHVIVVKKFCACLNGLRIEIHRESRCTLDFIGFHFNTSYLTDSYIVFSLKMESVSKITTFGLKMMVKSGLEKTFLKFLHGHTMSFLLLNLYF